MRDYGKVHSTFWTSEDIQSMSDTGRMLALYLLTGPHTNLMGCFRLPDGYVSEDLKWDPETVSKGFAELAESGFATRDDSSKWVLIHKYLRWNPIENPNQGVSAGRLFEQVPDRSSVKPLLIKVLRQYSRHFPGQILDDYETLSKPLRKPFLNQEQEQEQKQEQEQEQEAGGNSLAPAAADAGKGTGGEGATGKEAPNPLNAETWMAYKAAYTERYGTPPVRDAATNTKIKAIVKALGAEAPPVAHFFVWHNGARYVGGMHQIGYFATDYAKLRTEWATNSHMTQAKAQQADKTQTNADAFGPLIEAQRAKEQAERSGHVVQ